MQWIAPAEKTSYRIHFRSGLGQRRISCAPTPILLRLFRITREYGSWKVISSRKHLLRRSALAGGVFDFVLSHLPFIVDSIDKNRLPYDAGNGNCLPFGVRRTENGKYLRRRTLQNGNGNLKLLARSIEQYGQDFINYQVLAAIGRGGIARADSLREFARWIRCPKTGPVLQEKGLSMVNELLREDRQENQSGQIRRI